MDFQIGDKVTVRDEEGVIRFIGSTQFADGDWIGIELDSTLGRNDGALNGVRYFECLKPGKYGVFVRPLLVKLSTSQYLQKALQVTMDVNVLVERLQQKLKHALDETKHAKDEVSRMEIILKDKDTKLENLEVDVENAAVENEDLQAQNEKMKRTIEDLQREYDALKQDFKAVSEELSINRELEDEILAQAPSQVSASEAITLIKQNKEFAEALNQLKLTVSNKQDAVNLKDSELISVKEEFKFLKVAHSKTVEALKNSEETIEELQTQLEAVSTLHELVEYLSSENDTLQERVTDLDATVQELNEIHEIDKALLLDSKEQEERLKAEISRLLNSIESYESTIAELAENNSDLKRQLDQHLSKSRRLQGDPSIDLKKEEAKVTLEKSDYLNSILSTTKKSRQEIISNLVGSDFEKQFNALIELSDLSIKVRAQILLFEEQSIYQQKITVKLRRLLAMFNYLILILKHNILDINDSDQIIDKIKKTEEEIDLVHTRLLNSDFEGIAESSLFQSMLNISLAFESPEMGNHAELTYILENMMAEADLLVKIVRHIEVSSLGRTFSGLAEIYTTTKDCIISGDFLLKELHNSIDRDLMNLNALSLDSLSLLRNSLWEIISDICDLKMVDEDDVSEAVCEAVSTFQLRHPALEEDINRLKFLRDDLANIKLVFSDSASKSFVLNFSQQTNSTECSSSNDAALAVKDKQIHDLLLNIKLLEHNLQSMTESYTSESQRLENLVEELKEGHARLELQYKSLMNENLTLEKKAHELLSLDAITEAGQQTKHFGDLVSKKRYTEEMALCEEIAFLRSLLRKKPMPSKRKTGEVLWLSQPISINCRNIDAPHFMRWAHERRAYAIRMSTSSTQQMPKHRLNFQRCT